MEEGLSVRITAPDAELEALSFCASEPEAIADWIASLPMANTEDTATQIRQATFEITRLQTDYSTRLALLEAVRPTLHYLCARLDRAANNTQNQGDTIARLAQRLQTNLSSGYKAVVLSALQTPGKRTAEDALGLGIHRALSDLSRTLLRTLQFYVAPADRLWLDLNQLYLLAERANLQDTCRDDSENHARVETSIRDAYLRSVLLALATPNQLRHRQLSNVFSALELWTPTVSLEQASQADLFCVDLESNQGPCYARLLKEPAEPRCVRTEILIYELDAFLKDVEGSIPIPETVDESLIAHLADSWGVMQHRAFRRSPTNSSMKVCVGLRATHYFLSGGVDFIDQLDANDAMLQREVNPFLDEQEVVFVPQASDIKDVWDDAFDLRVKIPENARIQNPGKLLITKAKSRQTPEVRGSYLYYDTDTMDTSPGGYRVRWNEPLPINVQTGELVAMRDESDPRWSIAVIRWIRQDSNGASMGIELLAPRAIPVAIRVVHKKGGPSEYARAFLLPELAPIGQPASLITPQLPFQSGQKIHVSRQGIQTTAQLSGCVLKTESFNQFTFRMLDGYLENTQINLNMTSLQEMTGSHDTDTR